MKRNTLFVLAVFALGLAAFSGYSKVSKPSSYEECVLDAMDGVTSDVAARVKQKACRAMFPDYVSEAEALGLKN